CPSPRGRGAGRPGGPDRHPQPVPVGWAGLLPTVPRRLGLTCRHGSPDRPPRVARIRGRLRLSGTRGGGAGAERSSPGVTPSHPMSQEDSVEIAITGRNVNVSDRLRDYLDEKLAKVPQLEPRVQRIEVMVSHEPNPRQAKASERVEITLRSKGPVVRAEAKHDDR